MKRLICYGTCLVALAAVWNASADVTPSELKTRVDAGEKLVIIDIRETGEYGRDHIAKAINLPAGLIASKQLPPLGNVVIYGSGLGKEDEKAAAAAMNAKPGIRAEMLVGGYAAWREALGSTTSERGMTPEEIPLMTYQNLKEIDVEDLVLVDLRNQQPRERQGFSTIEAEPSARSLSDLGEEFPGARITRTPFERPRSRQSSGGAAVPPLMVLIDDGDGSAYETARKLKGQGIHRFVILAGGEEIIARQGRAGLQRRGQSVEASNQDAEPGN